MEEIAPEGPVWSQGLIPTLTPPSRLPFYTRQNKTTLPEAGLGMTSTFFPSGRNRNHQFISLVVSQGGKAGSGKILAWNSTQDKQHFPLGVPSERGGFISLNSSLLPVFVITMEAAQRTWLGSRKIQRVPPQRGNGQDTGQVTLAGELWSQPFCRFGTKGVMLPNLPDLSILESQTAGVSSFSVFLVSFASPLKVDRVVRWPWLVRSGMETKVGWMRCKSSFSSLLSSPPLSRNLLMTPNGFAPFQSLALSQTVVFFYVIHCIPSKPIISPLRRVLLYIESRMLVNQESEDKVPVCRIYLFLWLQYSFHTQSEDDYSLAACLRVFRIFSSLLSWASVNQFQHTAALASFINDVFLRPRCQHSAGPKAPNLSGAFN